MKRSALALVLALGGLAWVRCTDASSSGEAALREALATTAGRTEGARLNPHPWPLAAASPHRMRIEGRLGLDLPSGRREVRLDRVIDRGPDRRFRVVDDRARVIVGAPVERHEDGREGVFDGARFASRRRFGPWIAGDPLHGAHERLLREAHGLAADVLTAFADDIAWTESPIEGDVLIGRPVRWSAARLTARTSAAPLTPEALAAARDHETRWPLWLAATHRPTAVEGRLARDRATNEVVAGRLAIRGRATVGADDAGFDLLVEYTPEPLPDGAVFTLPENTLPEARTRTWALIEEVLGEDLNAVYRAR